MRPLTSFHTPSTSIDSALLVSPASPSTSSDQISEATHLNLTTPHLNTMGVPKGSVLEPLVFLDDNQLYLANKPDYAPHFSLPDWEFHSLPFPSGQAWVSSLTLLLFQSQIKTLPTSTLDHSLINSQTLTAACIMTKSPSFLPLHHPHPSAALVPGHPQGRPSIPARSSSHPSPTRALRSVFSIISLFPLPETGF